jgi:hypothetical protein
VYIGIVIMIPVSHKVGASHPSTWGWKQIQFLKHCF